MTRTGGKVARHLIVAAVMAVAMFWSGKLPGGAGSALPTAYAWIGHPATPMSYAGVARRTTRRTVAAGSAAAAGAYGAYGAYAVPPPVVVAPAPACREVVNVYGQVVTQCY